MCQINRREVEGNYRNGRGDRGKAGEQRTKVQLYTRSLRFLFSFLLCKNLSCFLKQRSSNGKDLAADPLCWGPGGREWCRERARLRSGRGVRREGTLQGTRARVVTVSAEGGARGVAGCVSVSSRSKRVNATDPRRGLAGQRGFRSGREGGALAGRAGARAASAEMPEPTRVPGGWRHRPQGRGAAGHLQALLSSTFTARGLIAPVRFIWEAAEGASCRVTAPRPGFSSTRCFAFGQMRGDQEVSRTQRQLSGHTAPATRFLLLSQGKAI